MKASLRAALLVLPLLALPVLAQKNQTQASGFAADKVYQFGEIDHINLFNGNVTALIPLGPKYTVSSALSYQFTLAYGGNDWEVYVNDYPNPDPAQQPFQYPYATPRVDTNAGFGWHLGFAGRLHVSRTCVGCLLFETPDGATHEFSPRLHRCDPNNQIPCTEPTDDKVWYTSNSTYYRLAVVTEEVFENGAFVSKTFYDVSAPDGTITRFIRTLDSQQMYRLDSIRDPFGNRVTVEYETLPNGSKTWWTIRDGHRTHVVEFITTGGASSIYKGDPKSYTYVKKLTLAAAHQQQAIYTFGYGDTDGLMPMSRLWVENQDCNVPPKTFAPVLQTVTLPDGSSWRTTMDVGDGGLTYSRAAGSSNACTNEASFGFSGTLLGLQLPTLGRLEWRYAQWFFPAIDPGGVCPDHVSGANICGGALSRSVGVTERLEWTKGTSPSPISRRTYQNQWFLNPIATEIVTVTTWTRATPAATALEQAFSKSRHYFALSNGDTPSQRKRGEYGLPYTPHVVSAGATNGDFPVPNPDPLTAGGERFLSSVLYEVKNGHDRIVRYNYVGYDGDDPKMVFGQESNRRQRSERTIFRQCDPITDACTDAHSTLSHSADFDGVGHYRVATSDGDAPGGGARTSVTNYNRAIAEVESSGSDTGTFPGNFVLPPTNQPWILNTWSSQEVSEAGSGSAGARTFAWFDRSNGFLHRTRTLAGSSRGGNDLVAELSHGGDGNVTREDYFGGDVTPDDTAAGFQPLSTTQSLATMNLGTRRYRIEHAYAKGVRFSSWYVNAASAPLSFKTLNLTIDGNTGLATESRDSAGLATTFNYDTSGRLSSMSPPGVAPTTYAYAVATLTTPARATITRSDTLQVVQFDDLGRVSREIARMPPARGAGNPYLTMRETKYTPMGWKDSVSEVEKITPETNDAAATHGAFTPAKLTRYLGYDAFGRPASVMTPDGKQTAFRYVGMKKTDRTVTIATALNTETDATTTEEYDRHGRLSQVTEPSGDNNTGITTAYGYDVAGRLASVRTSVENPLPPPIVPGQPPPPTFTTQTRLFAYDNRGFLLSETHPEKGASGDGTVTYGAYDARGHARNKREGDPGTRFDLKFTFDAGERLTKVEELVPESTSARRVAKEFVYATNNNGADLRNGKLLSATRHHYDASLGHLVTVTETYEYAGIGGQPSKRTTTIPQTTVIPSRTFTAEQTYEAAYGALASVIYPTCTGCPIVSNQQVSYGYVQGLLKDVAGFGTVYYAPNGLLANVVHKANPTTEVIVDTWTPDPSGVPRPWSISAAKGSTPAWSSGTYQYDGAGNIKQIGDRVYFYDGVSRLVYDGYRLPPTESGVRYTYDAFGNRMSESVGGCTVRSNGFPACWSSGVLTPEVASATNRYRDGAAWHASYDEAGNLTHGDGTDYGWDGVGTLRNRIRGSSSTHYLYTASDERIAVVDFNGETRQRTLWTLRGFGNQLLRTYAENATGAMSWTEDQVWRGGSILANVSPSGTKHYTLDHLGSPRLITDNGGLTEEQKFAAFGTGGATGAGALQFTAHERDWSAEGLPSLDYMHARYYSPSAGRFLSVDPAKTYKANASAPQRWNRYAYVRNNPLVKIDPDGQDEWTMHWKPTSKSVGHAAIAIENRDAQGRPTGTATVTELWPSDAIGKKSLHAPADYRHSVVRVADIGSFPSSMERPPDAIVRIKNNAQGDAAARAALSAYAARNPQYIAPSVICSTYVAAGTTAVGLPATQTGTVTAHAGPGGMFWDYRRNVVTPIALYNSLVESGSEQVEVVKALPEKDRSSDVVIK